MKGSSATVKIFPLAGKACAVKGFKSGARASAGKDPAWKGFAGGSFGVGRARRVLASLACLALVLSLALAGPAGSGGVRAEAARQAAEAGGVRAEAARGTAARGAAGMEVQAAGPEAPGAGASGAGAGDVTAASDASYWGPVSGAGLDGTYHAPQAMVASMVDFGGKLYAGTWTQGGAGDIWRKDDGGWTLIEPSWFDGPDEALNLGAVSMAVHGDRLFVGTKNLGGCEVLRYDGSRWTRVVGPGASVGRGFGDPANHTAACMASFGGWLYVGTQRDSGRLQVWRTVDGNSWSQVDMGALSPSNTGACVMHVFNGYLYMGTSNSANGCQVWRTQNGTLWTMSAGLGFGSTSNVDASSMAVFGGRLYVGTRNSSGLWVVSTSDGLVWSRNDGGSFGSSNVDATSMEVFNSRLYVGTQNYSQGAQVWSTPDGGSWSRSDGGALGSNTIASSMHVSSNVGGLLVGTCNRGEIFLYDTTRWTQINTTHFSDNCNIEITKMVACNGFLYAGTYNLHGCEVWRYDGATWTRLAAQGFGNPENEKVTSMCASWNGYELRLYVGTENDSTGCEVWSYHGGTTWVRLMAGGFGDPNNQEATSMAICNNKLHVGTHNGTTGCELWVFTGSAADEVVNPELWWVQANADGFGDPLNRELSSLTVYGISPSAKLLYAGTYNDSGCQVWRSGAQGGYPYADWVQVNANGFGDANNSTASSLASFGDNLVAGTENDNTGCEVWLFDNTTWRKVAGGGFGDPMAFEVTSLLSHQDRLYAAVTARVDGRLTGRVWSSGGAGGFPFTDWRRESLDGFGDAHNGRIPCLEGYFSCVHAGTQNGMDGARVWCMGSVSYLAEGSTDRGFETYVLVQNPGGQARHVDFTLNTGGGALSPEDLQNVEIPAGSRRTFNLGAYVTTTDVSTMVRCRDGVTLCERAVYWRPSPGSPWAVGHDAAGVNDPAPVWYLAEGATDLGFETFVLVQNPGVAEVHVDFALQTGGGELSPPDLQNVAIPPGSRRTFNLGAYVTTTDVSTRVQCRDGEVICERAVYWRPSPGSPWAVGHDAAGVNHSAPVWYLAEGSTDLGFETYILVQNPWDTAAHVDIFLQTGGGELSPLELQNVAIPPGSRRTFNLGAYVTTTDVSTVVRCRDGEVICERAVYWRPSPGSPWAVGHDEVGVNGYAPIWYLAEGATDMGFETYLLVQNPNGYKVTLDIILNTLGGEVRPPGLQGVEIGAKSRRTFNLGPYLTTTDLSIRVVSRGGPVICERAVYWRPSPGSPWAVGHDAHGVVP